MPHFESLRQMLEALKCGRGSSTLTDRVNFFSVRCCASSGGSGQV